MSKHGRVISVTSGKGGVGKTLTTVNLALAARRSGLSVLILDGDLGLANVDVVLGIQSRYNIRDVLDGHAALADIIVEGPLGIHVIPTGSGISSLTELSQVQKQEIMSNLDSVQQAYDLVLIDTGAGIANTVMHLNMAADTSLVVTTGEPHAMTDAYALIKVLAEEYGRNQFCLTVNQARSAEEGLKIAERIAEVAERFLKVSVQYVGHVPFDPHVPKSVMQRKAASEHSTFTIAGQAWNDIARRMIGESPVAHRNHDTQEFWKNLLWSEYASNTASARI